MVLHHIVLSYHKFLISNSTIHDTHRFNTPNRRFAWAVGGLRILFLLLISMTQKILSGEPEDDSKAASLADDTLVNATQRRRQVRILSRAADLKGTMSFRIEGENFHLSTGAGAF